MIYSADVAYFHAGNILDRMQRLRNIDGGQRDRLEEVAREFIDRNYTGGNKPIIVASAGVYAGFRKLRKELKIYRYVGTGDDIVTTVKEILPFETVSDVSIFDLYNRTVKNEMIEEASRASIA